jgi:hypothetical protein
MLGSADSGTSTARQCANELWATAIRKAGKRQSRLHVSIGHAVDGPFRASLAESRRRHRQIP